MAKDSSNIAGQYPLPVYNYRVTIGERTLACSEVSGLNLEYEKVVYKHGFSFLGGYHILRGQPNPVNVSLKKAVMNGDAQLYEMMASGEKDLFFGKIARDIIIDLCNPDGTPQVRWKVKGAVPLKLEGPSFNASTNDLAMESIELTGQQLTIEYF